MRISDFSVRHPVTIFMGVLLAILLGIVSLGRLTMDLLPDMSFPVAAVITTYEGAGPEEIENMITRPLEETMGTVNNVVEIRSSSTRGTSTVIVEFDWGTDMDFAALEMREKVDMMRRFLPPEAEEPLVFKFDPSIMPILQVGMSGTADLADIRSYGERVVKGRLERIDGVASVNISGGLDRAILVHLHPHGLFGYGISPQEVRQSLRAQNLNLPGGTIEDGRAELLLRTMGEFQEIEEIKDIPVMSPQGVVVSLQEIAEIEDGYKPQTQYAFMNGEPSVAISVQKQAAANTVEMARRVNEELALLEEENPDISFSSIMDQSVYVERSIAVLGRSAVNGAILAVIMLFLFLKSLRSTFIIGLSIPISVVATFILVHFAGLTLNMLTLGGLALGVGMLVDNAIVVLESIYRHRQRGYDAIKAAALGSSEVGRAITVSTITTVVVFLPVVYVEGMASIIFQEMALTVIFALVMSLLVSLTLIPVLSSRLMVRPPRKEVQGGLIDKVTRNYSRRLRWALRHRKIILAIGVAAFCLGLALLPIIGTEFLPPIDQGRLTVNLRLPAGSRLEETEAVAEQVVEIANQIPELDTVFTSLGGGMSIIGGAARPERGQVEVKLVPRGERARSTAQVTEEVRREVLRIPGADIDVREQDMFMGGAGLDGDPLTVMIRGEDLAILRNLADEAVARIESVPGTREVASGFTEGRPELQVIVDKDKASTYGLTVFQVAQAINAASTGQVATRYRVAGDEIDVVVQLEPASLQTVEDLKWFPLISPLGMTLPLSDIADFSYERGPVSIRRENQMRTVRVGMEIYGRDLGGVTEDVQRVLGEMYLPPGYLIDYGGQQQDMWDAFGSLAFALVLAVVLVYMVMASQFESLIYPLIIMFSVPFAFTGVAVSLALTGRTLNIASVIGVIMLSGIVVNNAIVFVDYINRLRAQGENRTLAIVSAGETRLRPILMTSLTTVLGLFPMSLGLGQGGELLAPLATVVIGGLLVSTFLTLFFIPVVYTLFEDMGRRLAEKRSGLISKKNAGS